MNKKILNKDYESIDKWHQDKTFNLKYSDYKPGSKYRFYDPTFVKPLQSLCKKYIKFKPIITKNIEKFLYDNDITNTNTLSIHIRGTDMFSDVLFKNMNHASGQKKLIDYETYIKPYIIKSLETKNCNKLFLATDEQEIYDHIKKDFNSILIKYETNLAPKNSQIGLHYINQNKDFYTKYQTGIDVLTEIGIMSSCKYSLYMKSNVSLVSILMRNNLNYEFIDDHIDYTL